MLAQPLRDGENEIGGGDARSEAADKAAADHGRDLDAERFAPGRIEKIPQYAWIPFGGPPGLPDLPDWNGQATPRC